MASSITRGFSRCMRASLTKSSYPRKEYNSNLFANLSGIAANHQPSGSWLGHSSQRSLWYLAPSSSRGFNGIPSLSSFTCSCGGLHTEGDHEFVNLLKREVAEEKERMLELPEMSDGWKVEMKGSECNLSKKIEGDTLKVSFNVNASVPPTDDPDPEADEEIVSKPDFTVEITKPSTQDIVTFDCFFADMEEEMQEEVPSNNFSVRSVFVHKGEINASTYTIETENLDPNVYKHLLQFLADRGLSNDFGEEIIDLATSLENQEYVKSLVKLQNFVSCK